MPPGPVHPDISRFFQQIFNFLGSEPVNRFMQGPETLNIGGQEWPLANAFSPILGDINPAGAGSGGGRGLAKFIQMVREEGVEVLPRIATDHWDEFRAAVDNLEFPGTELDRLGDAIAQGAAEAGELSTEAWLASRKLFGSALSRLGQSANMGNAPRQSIRAFEGLYDAVRTDDALLELMGDQLRNVGVTRPGEAASQAAQNLGESDVAFFDALLDIFRRQQGGQP